MKITWISLMVLAVIGFGGLVQANDSGTYSVQPYGAKYNVAAKSFSFTGQYAKELNKILPPGLSVITAMGPKLKKQYEKNFRGIVMKDSAGNSLIIDCSSADVKPTDKSMTIVEKPNTTCSVTMVGKAQAEDEPTQKIPVKEALKKAAEANRL